MTSIELLKEINDFLHPSGSYSYLLEVVSELANIYDAHELMISKSLSTNNEHLSTVRDAARKALDESMSVFRANTRFKDLFDAIGSFESNLGELSDWTYIEDQGYLEELKKSVYLFSDYYENYLRDNTTYSASLDLIRISKTLEGQLIALVNTLKIIASNLEGVVRINKEREDVLTLVLHPSDYLDVLVDKLQALVRIHEEICRLLNVSTAEYPLRVIKLESGSLWAKLFGQSKVIELLTDLIRSSVQFLHRNYTNEGQVTSMSQRTQLVEANLNLEARLRAQGIDTRDMRESIAKAGAVIAKESLKLLADEGSVGLNDEYYSVGSAVDRMIAEKSKTKLLEDGNQDNPPLLGDGNPQDSEPS